MKKITTEKWSSMAIAMAFKPFQIVTVHESQFIKNMSGVETMKEGDVVPGKPSFT